MVLLFVTYLMLYNDIFDITQISLYIYIQKSI